jgi:hypothetical protein
VIHSAPKRNGALTVDFHEDHHVPALMAATELVHYGDDLLATSGPNWKPTQNHCFVVDVDPRVRKRRLRRSATDIERTSSQPVMISGEELKKRNGLVGEVRAWPSPYSIRLTFQSGAFALDS